MEQSRVQEPKTGKNDATPKNKNSRSRLQNAARLGMILAAGALVWYVASPLWPLLWPALKSGDQAAIEQALRSAGSWDGLLALALLQFIQVVSIVLPGMPIQMAAGGVFGTAAGVAVCWSSYLLANWCVFRAARALGRSAESWLGDSGGLQWMFQMAKRAEEPGFLIMMANATPMLPNGSIPYVAAQTRLRDGAFVAAAACGSLVQIILNCAAGKYLLRGSWWISAAIVAVEFVYVAVLWLAHSRLQGLWHRLRSKKSAQNPQ